MAGPDRVLVPTFGRPREDEMLAYALETFPGAEVTALAVVTPLDDPLSEGGVLERKDERLAEAREDAASLAASVDGGERVEVDVVEGRPGNVVPRYAAEEEFDHVVVRGQRAESLVRRFLGRDVAATIVERASTPVTVLE